MKSKVFQFALHGSVALVLAVSAVTNALAADWAQWRGPDLNGISKEKSWTTDWPKDGPKILWKAKVGIGFSSFAVSGGRVYTIGNRSDKDTLFCFDAATGKEIWKNTYDCKLLDKYYEGGPGGTPTVDGNSVYVLSKFGDVLKLDAATGSLAWSKNVAKEIGAAIPTWGFAGSPLVRGNLLILNVGKYGMALDKGSGKVVWMTGTDAAGYATPIPFTAGGKSGIAVFSKDSLAAVDEKTGMGMWMIPWKTEYDVNAADPIFGAEGVFLSSGYGTGGGYFKFEGGKPVQVWRNKEMHNQLAPSILFGESLYGIHGEPGGKADLRCVDLKTGAVKWKEASPGYGAMMIADGKLIVLCEKGELLIAQASPAGFKELARAQILGGRCWTAPVLSDGRIFARNAKGDVVCVDVSAPAKVSANN